MLRRIAGVLAFVPCAFVFVAAMIPTLLVAATAWLIRGPDENRTDRILLNPATTWLAELPFRIAGTTPP